MHLASIVMVQDVHDENLALISRKPAIFVLAPEIVLLQDHEVGFNIQAGPPGGAFHVLTLHAMAGQVSVRICRFPWKTTSELGNFPATSCGNTD